MHENKEMERCAQECLDCYQKCVATIQHCLTKGGKHAGADHIRILNDCLEICKASAGFLLRGSAFHHETCGACAEICRTCAADCRRFGDDKIMLTCADACERCAKSCDKMSAVPARH